jgi:molybdopterin converting factor small subunit
MEVALHVVVLLWGPMRRAAGRASIRLDLPAGTRLDAALDSLYEACPGLAPHRASARAAVGVEYAPAETVLRDGDEISLIPPVQGG